MAALATSTFLRSTLSARIADIWGLLPLLLASVLAATSRVGRRRLLRVAGALVLVVTAGAVVVAGRHPWKVRMGGSDDGFGLDR